MSNWCIAPDFIICTFRFHCLLNDCVYFVSVPLCNIWNMCANYCLWHCGNLWWEKRLWRVGRQIRRRNWLWVEYQWHSVKSHQLSKIFLINAALATVACAEIFLGGGGGRFFKKSEHFHKLFLDRPFGFSQFFEITLRTLICKNIFCVAGNFFKKQAKKIVFGLFWNILNKRLRFFGACFPLKVSNIAAKGVFKNFLRLVRQNGCRKVIPKGDPLEKFGIQNWGGGWSPPPSERYWLQVWKMGPAFILKISKHKWTNANNNFVDLKASKFFFGDPSKFNGSIYHTRDPPFCKKRKICRKGTKMALILNRCINPV